MTEHRALAAGRWRELPLVEQLANIGSEVGRIVRWHERDAALAEASLRRALELIDFTLADSRWRGRFKEIARFRELLVDAAAGGTAYRTTFEELDRYLLPFAVAARRRASMRQGSG